MINQQMDAIRQRSIERLKRATPLQRNVRKHVLDAHAIFCHWKNGHISLDEYETQMDEFWINVRELGIEDVVVRAQRAFASAPLTAWWE